MHFLFYLIYKYLNFFVLFEIKPIVSFLIAELLYFTYSFIDCHCFRVLRNLTDCLLRIQKWKLGV